MDLEEALQRAHSAAWVQDDQPLTPRKREVVQLVAAGLSDKQIARRMSVSVRTIHAHLEQIRSQLGLHNRAQVAVWAVSSGLPLPERVDGDGSECR